MNKFGFVRISAISPVVHVGNPVANVDNMIQCLADDAGQSDIILFPELGITGYSCGDLFQQDSLLDASDEQLLRLAGHVSNTQLVVVGCPIRNRNHLYNCAAVMQGGNILGIVPKQYLPTYKEFYEGRWFKSGLGMDRNTRISFPTIKLAVDTNEFGYIPFGTDLLFQCSGMEDLIVGVEICEDLWVPIPPSSQQAIGGAVILLNLSASTETVGKSGYRRDLVVGQSGRCMAVYAYACAHSSESTTDTVQPGHNLIAENGSLLGESEKFQWGKPVVVTRDVDVQLLMRERRQQLQDQRQLLTQPYDYHEFKLETQPAGKLERTISGTPFVPRKSAELADRCKDINNITSIGLTKRLSMLHDNTPVWFGVSGGADSTKVAFDIRRAFQNLGRPLKLVHGVTMPGFGTTDHTKENALGLIEGIGFTGHEWDIRPICMDVFRAIGHKPFGINISDEMDIYGLQQALAELPAERRFDLVFERVQASVRTLLLMSRGFVVGTGDLTEIALGWSTYNGDHMSMYNSNCGCPKSLVCFLIEYAANTEFKDGAVKDTLLSIANTTISPELLPAQDGKITQSTEDILGPFLLHDFVLSCVVRHGMDAEKIRYLMDQAIFPKDYDDITKDKVLKTFFDRFYKMQFKRSCVPDGPKVGSVALSPRGDWRQPTDVDDAILAAIRKGGIR